LVGIIVNSYIPAEDMARWGWRVPMLVGCMIVPGVFLLRRSLEETTAFASRAAPASVMEMLSGLASNAGTIALVVLMGTMMTVPFYTITAYTPTFGVRVLHLATLDVFIVTLSVGISNFCWLPIMGALSDRLGRPLQCRIFALLTLLTAYPAMSWLVSSPDFTRLMVVELWLSFLYASYNAAFVPLGTELVPSATRTTAFALAFSLATAIFGGFTPAICTWLVQQTGNPAIPGAWLSAAGLLAFCAATVVTRSADRKLPQAGIQLEAGS
jgi:MFS family permease